jgi:hypothetical protein
MQIRCRGAQVPGTCNSREMSPLPSLVSVIGPYKLSRPLLCGGGVHSRLIWRFLGETCRAELQSFTCCRGWFGGGVFEFAAHNNHSTVTRYSGKACRGAVCAARCADEWSGRGSLTSYLATRRAVAPRDRPLKPGPCRWRRPLALHAAASPNSDSRAA